MKPHMNPAVSFLASQLPEYLRRKPPGSLQTESEDQKVWHSLHRASKHPPKKFETRHFGLAFTQPSDNQEKA